MNDDLKIPRHRHPWLWLACALGALYLVAYLTGCSSADLGRTGRALTGFGDGVAAVGPYRQPVETYLLPAPAPAWPRTIIDLPSGATKFCSPGLGGQLLCH